MKIVMKLRVHANPRFLNSLINRTPIIERQRPTQRKRYPIERPSPHPHRSLFLMRRIKAMPPKVPMPPMMYNAKATTARPIPCFLAIKISLCGLINRIVSRSVVPAALPRYLLLSSLLHRSEMLLRRRTAGGQYLPGC